MRKETLCVVLLSCVLLWVQVTTLQGTDGGPPVGASEQTVELLAVRDTTLIENLSGELSNGEGSALFVGRTRQPMDSRRRVLLMFDVTSAVPAAAQVVSVTLTLTLVHTHAGDEPIELRRLLTAWGEGASKTPGGRGAPAMPGDATWLHTFFPEQRWSQPGGDYAATPSAIVTAGGGGGVYTWGSTARMVADVQAWLAAPQHNLGWLLLGNETIEGTAKSFASREHEEAGLQPRLRVTFRPGGG